MIANHLVGVERNSLRANSYSFDTTPLFRTWMSLHAVWRRCKVHISKRAGAFRVWRQVRERELLQPCCIRFLQTRSAASRI